VDVYVEGTFKTFRIQTSSSITVEKGRSVLLCLQPSLREELTDCPGLEMYISKQPKARAKGKRAAESLVSPAKSHKMPRQSLEFNSPQFLVSS